MTPFGNRLASLSLIACTAVLLPGCAAADSPPVDLGPGVVTPGAPGSEAAPASVPAESPAASTSPNSSTSPSPSASSSPSTQRVPSPFRDDDAEVEAEDQSGDGRTLRLEDAHLSRTDGFVAVYTSDGEQLLGSAAIPRSVDDGDDQSVSVPLATALTGTTELLVVLHADDGDGRFEATKDPRVTGDDDDSELVVDRLTYQVR